MHRSTLPRTQWRTRPTGSSRSLWTRTLENRLTRNGTSRRGAYRSRCCSLHSRRDRTWRRGLIYGTRASLWNDHAWRGRLRRPSDNVWRRRTWRDRRSLRRGRGRNWRRCRYTNVCTDRRRGRRRTRRNKCWSRCHGRRDRTLRGWRRNDNSRRHCLRHNWSGCNNRPHNRRRDNWLRDNGWCSGHRHWPWWRRCLGFLLLSNRAQDISWP